MMQKQGLEISLSRTGSGTNVTSLFLWPWYRAQEGGEGWGEGGSCSNLLNFLPAKGNVRYWFESTAALDTQQDELHCTCGGSDT